MGESFGCYWQPVALSREIGERDPPPVRVKVMGEDLVALRDTEGRVELIEPHCAHRGAKLFFGRNEACGIRGIYHGWKYDVNGSCVDMPNVPPGTVYHDKISIKACPTREFGDIVWAYFGPQERMPEAVPQLESGMLPPLHRYVTKRLQACNWAHSMEGALDTAHLHFSFLHTPAPAQFSNENATVAADKRRLPWLRDNPMPRFTVLEHEVGFVVGGARRADRNAAYGRITQFMLPAHSVAPSAMPGEIYYGYSWVRITDETGWIYVYAWNPERPIFDDERARFDRGGFGQFAALGPGFVPLRNRANDYLIDCDEQKQRSFNGIRGVAEQDAIAQDNQGFIADRAREHLTPTDMAIVRFRRSMLGGATALREGKEPAAVQCPGHYAQRGRGCLAPANLSLEEVMRHRFGSMNGRVSSADCG